MQNEFDTIEISKGIVCERFELGPVGDRHI